MKKVLLIFLLVFGVIVCVNKFHADEDIDSSWKERALEAQENVKDIEEGLKINDTLEGRLRAKLEGAYALIVEMPEIVVKSNDKMIVYHLMLNYEEDGILDIGYAYDVNTHVFLGVRIDMLPKNVGLTMLPGPEAQDHFMVTNNVRVEAPSIVFSKTNPFDAVVLKAQK